jgi:hypothetical protein
MRARSDEQLLECGAVEYIPAEFRDSVGPAIEAAIAKGDPRF